MKDPKDEQTGAPLLARRKPGRPRKYANAAERYAAYVAKLKERGLRRTAVLVRIAPAPMMEDGGQDAGR